MDYLAVKAYNTELWHSDFTFLTSANDSGTCSTLRTYDSKLFLSGWSSKPSFALTGHLISYIAPSYWPNRCSISEFVTYVILSRTPPQSLKIRLFVRRVYLPEVQHKIWESMQIDTSKYPTLYIHCTTSPLPNSTFTGLHWYIIIPLDQHCERLKLVPYRLMPLPLPVHSVYFLSVRRLHVSYSTKKILDGCKWERYLSRTSLSQLLWTSTYQRGVSQHRVRSVLSRY